jgi:ribosomal protein S18 acetylase RimI-like enzyme
VTPPVRVASPDDATVVARLLAEFRTHTGRDWPPEATMRASVERLIVRDDTEYLLGGEPAMGVVQLRYRHSVWFDADDCHVEDVFVRAEARGTGLGRALVRTAIERARERGCRRLELDTAEENAPALALYRSLGFRSGGDEPGRLAVFMRRRIPENMPPGVE